MQQRATQTVKALKTAHSQQALAQRRVSDSEAKVRHKVRLHKMPAKNFDNLSRHHNNYSKQHKLIYKEAHQKKVATAENSAQVASQQVQILQQLVGEANTQIEDL